MEATAWAKKVMVAVAVAVRGEVAADAVEPMAKVEWTVGLATAEGVMAMAVAVAVVLEAAAVVTGAAAVVTVGRTVKAREEVTQPRR